MKKIAIKKADKKTTVTIELPSSKSISNRVLIIRALSYNWFSIENLSESNDTQVLDKILKSNESEFDVGDAGTAMRFLTAFLSKIVGEWTLTGSARMQDRPIGKLVDALSTIGAKISYLKNDGYPPLKIMGSNLTGSDLEIGGDISSQYISALLLIAPSLINGLKIKIKGKLISKPYVEMTLALMKYFGVHASMKGDQINVEYQNYEPRSIHVESDWSAASYWYEIAALSEKADIKLIGLEKNSWQGDAVLSKIYKELGIETSFSKRGIRITKSGLPAKKLELDLENYPDIALAIVVTAAIKKIPFKIEGLQSLKIKECNRIEALQKELFKFGIIVNETGEGVLEINEFPGELNQKNIEIETYNDHRIAMAFAPIAMIYDNISIKDPQVVKKSYPKYWEDMKKAGFEIQEM